jgi:hypothetical protein
VQGDASPLAGVRGVTAFLHSSSLAASLRPVCPLVDALASLTGRISSPAGGMNRVPEQFRNICTTQLQFTFRSVEIDINVARCGRGKDIASAPAQQTATIQAIIIYQYPMKENINVWQNK